MPCMQHSRISCRPMFGTIQRHNLTAIGVSDRYLESFSISVISGGDNMTTVKEAGLATIDMKLEVIVIPVTDVNRAEQFYRKLGWRQDVTPPGSGVYQFTPHGSACSVQFGGNLTSAAAGSAQRTYLIVSDIEEARNALVDAGIAVS